MRKSNFTEKNIVRGALLTSATIATLVGAQMLAFRDQSVVDVVAQSQDQTDIFAASAIVQLQAQQSTATLIPTATDTSTAIAASSTPSIEPSKAPIIVLTKARASVVTASPTTVVKKSAPTATSTVTKVPTATKVQSQVVRAQQQPRPQSQSSKP